MLGMENPEEVLMILDRYRTLKQKNIPKELDEYLSYVAKTGDPVYNWSTIQYLFREKLTSVIREFHDTTPSLEELPPCPNVDPFKYEKLKTALLERLDQFHAAPFTVQRLCELLTNPKKHYCRLDKFMRALEKNILVVSTIEPGRKKAESENGDSASLDVSLDSDVERENSAPASASNVADASVGVKTTDDPETAAVKVIDGQPLEVDANDSIADDGDVEVKDSLETLPLSVDDAKNNSIVIDEPTVEVDEEPTVVEAPTENIDVVDERKDEKEPESEATPDLSNETESKSTENKTEIKSTTDDAKATASKIPEVQLPIEDNVVVADSSVPDASPAVELSEAVESLPVETDGIVTTSLEVDSQTNNEAITSSVDVKEDSNSKALPKSEEDDSECEPSLAKIPRLELNTVDTTSVPNEVAVVAAVLEVAEQGAIDSAPLPIAIDATEDPISTTSEVVVPIEVESVEPFASKATKPVEADSTEPEHDTVAEESIADAPATSPAVPEPIITESIAVALEAEVASSDDIAEVNMAVVEEEEVDVAPTVSAVDSTAAIITSPEANVAPTMVADTTAAMEATPIIPSDEQMDVDEINSADSMDL